MPDDDARHEPTLTRRGVLAGAAALAGANALLRPRLAAGSAGATAAAARHAAVERGVDVTAARGRDREGRFGLMFKKLDAFAPPDDALRELAQRMAEPATAGADLDNDRLP